MVGEKNFIGDDTKLYNRDVSKERIISHFIENRFLFIIRTHDFDKAIKVFDILVRSGAKCIEFTSTVPNFAQAIFKAKELVKGMDIIVGAGTVLNKEIAFEALEGDPDFIVNPVQNLEVLEIAKEYGKVCFMGGFTPTEIYNAWESGADFVKVFPASTLGPKFIRSLKSGPLPFVRILASGGMEVDVVRNFLAQGADVIGIGNEVANMVWIENNQFDEIEKKAFEYLSILEQVF